MIGYAGGIIQQTGEQLNTTKFSLIRNVKRNLCIEKESGLKALEYWSEIKELEKSVNFVNYFEIKYTVFNSHEMNFVDLIDTPGLCDDINYNYDIDEIMDKLCNKSDIVLVFIDEHVVLSCNKTKEIIEKLNKKYKEKLVYCLTKVDLLNRNEISNSSFRFGCGLTEIGVNVDKTYSLSIPEPNKFDKNNSCDLNEICKMIEEKVDNKIVEFSNKIVKDINKLEIEIEERMNDTKKFRDFKFKELMLFVLNMIFVEIMYILMIVINI